MARPSELNSSVKSHRRPWHNTEEKQIEMMHETIEHTAPEKRKKMNEAQKTRKNTS